MTLSDFTKLIVLARSGTKLWANQITLSCDSLPNNEEHTEQLIDSLAQYFYWATRDYFQEETEMHVTFASTKSFLKYILGTSGWADSLHYLSLYSFSHIDLEDIPVIRALNPNPLNLNYNCLIPEGIDSSNIRMFIQHITQIAEQVESVYLIMFKYPIGKEMTAAQFRQATNRFHHDYQVINTVLRHVPDHLRPKIHIDGCLQDIRKYINTGMGCSANISKMQVWPDQSVSGCPYSCTASKSFQEAGETYDFDKCYFKQIADGLRNS